MLKNTIRTAAVLIALSAPATASAATYWPAATIAKAIRVADRHWVGSPCSGKEQILWVSASTLATDMGDDGSYLADAAASTCTVHLDAYAIATSAPYAGLVCRGSQTCTDAVAPRRYSAPFMCTILMHEFGHLDGLDHSPNPNDVMNALSNRIADPCAAAFR